LPSERAALRSTAQITNRDREYMSYSIVPSLIQDEIAWPTKFAGFASQFPLAFPCERGCAKFLSGSAAHRAKIAYVANFQGLSI
jgi:hypothetical protein